MIRFKFSELNKESQKKAIQDFIENGLIVSDFNLKEIEQKMRYRVQHYQLFDDEFDIYFTLNKKDIDNVMIIGQLTDADKILQFIHTKKDILTKKEISRLEFLIKQGWFALYTMFGRLNNQYTNMGKMIYDVDYHVPRWYSKRELYFETLEKLGKVWYEDVCTLCEKLKILGYKEIAYLESYINLYTVINNLDYLYDENGNVFPY